MSVLSAQSIRRKVVIEPFAERTIHECGLSYGLSASGYDLRIKDDLFLKPGHSALCTTVEYLELPNDVQGIVYAKSTHARNFLHVWTTKFEAGWKGYPTIELKNDGPIAIVLPAGSPVCQMEFQWLDEPTDMPYAGKYQGQENVPVPAIFER